MSDHSRNKKISLRKLAIKKNRAIRTEENVSYVNRIKCEKGCKVCGLNSDPIYLAFDHLPEFEKGYEINEMVRRCYSLVMIDAEIAKCCVVCHNCHAKITHDRYLAKKNSNKKS